MLKSTLKMCKQNEDGSFDQLYISIAEGFAAKGNYEKALSTLENCLTQTEAATALKTDFNYNLGVSAYNDKSYEKAAEILADFLNNKTYSADAKEYFYLCAKAMYVTNKESSIKLFEKIKNYKDASDYLPKKQTYEIRIQLTMQSIQGTWRSPDYQGIALLYTFKDNSVLYDTIDLETNKIIHSLTGTFKIEGSVIVMSFSDTGLSGQNIAVEWITATRFKGAWDEWIYTKQ